VPFSLFVGAFLSVPVNAQSRTVSVGDAVINYEINGTGDLLVLIHGWSQDLTIWDDQAKAFAPHYRVIRYDRRGFGKSTGFADATADPDDLRILLDSLGIRSAFLLGISAGSRTVLNFAVAFPDRVRGMVVYGQAPIPGFNPMPPTPVAAFRDIALKHGLDSVGKAIRAHPLSWMPPERPELQELLTAQWARYSGRDLLEPRPESGRVPHARLDQVASLRVPTLVISGDHDLPLYLLVGDTLVRRIQGAQRVLIRNAGHGAHFAQPAEFNAVVLRFLSGIATRPSGFFSEARPRR
jgi:pimeloyl-ACP methyl ester carboxylesterase